MTHTYVELEVSREAYREIAEKLRAADYGHAFDGDTIDMHGIALVPATAGLAESYAAATGTPATPAPSEGATVLWEGERYEHAFRLLRDLTWEHRACGPLYPGRRWERTLSHALPPWVTDEIAAKLRARDAEVEAARKALAHVATEIEGQVEGNPQWDHMHRMYWLQVAGVANAARKRPGGEHGD